jgi:hypothetical protein
MTLSESNAVLLTLVGVYGNAVTVEVHKFAASESMGVSQILCRAYGTRLWCVPSVCSWAITVRRNM